MKLIMLGPPGAGKGTQAAKLSVSLNLPTLSTGHILRTAIKEGLPVGLQIMGKRFSEDKIIGVASAYQKATADKGFEKKIPENALRGEG